MGKREADVQAIQAGSPDAPGDMGVRKLMSILMGKGQVTRRKEGRKYVYAPKQKTERAGASAMQHVLATFFGGSVEEAMAAHLANPKTKLTEDQLANLADMIDEARTRFGKKNTQEPELTHRIAPKLNRTLRAKAPATVKVSFVVDEQGKVTNLKVEDSTDPRFEELALDAVAKWRFKPGTRDGKPVAMPMWLPIKFAIAPGDKGYLGKGYRRKGTPSSSRASASTRPVLTKPIIFSGSQLELNAATSAAGSVRVEIQSVGGKPFPGFALADCQPLSGDQIYANIAWGAGAKVGDLSRASAWLGV